MSSTISTSIRVEDQEGLPTDFIEELCYFLRAIPGGKNILSMMFTALSQLDVDSQSIECNDDDDDDDKHGQNKINKNKISKCVIEIRTLQHFIFSNITKMDTIPKGIRSNLVYKGMLSNVTNINSMSLEDHHQELKKPSQSDLTQNMDKNNNNNNNNNLSTHPFLFTEFFSHLTKLKALRIEASGVPWEPKLPCFVSSWDPFLNARGPVIFPSLELFELSDYEKSLDIATTINNLIKYCSFPNLQLLKLPDRFYKLTNRVQIRSLLDYLLSLPNLKSFLPLQLFKLVSREMLEELVGYAPALLLTIKRLTVFETDPPHLRDLLLKSPHLIGLSSLSFDNVFKSRHDFDNTSDWLFKMNWIGNITHFALTGQECQLSQHSVENILTSPFLNNLKILSFDRSPMDEIAQDALSCLLSSDRITKLTILRLHNPNDDHLAIITKSPHLTQLQYLNCLEIPETFFSSISSSKTLTNLIGMGFGTDTLASLNRNEAAVMTKLIPLFHSPNIQHFTKTDFINLSAITLNGLKSFLSSPYVEKQNCLMIFHRKEPDPTEWSTVLFSNAAWSNLLHLRLRDNELSDVNIKALSETTHFTNLKTLDLSGNSKITDQGLMYLAQSPHLINVEDLNLGFVSNLFRSDPDIPPFHSNEALIQFFQSPYLCKLRNLSISCHPLQNFEALEYLVDNPHIFYNGKPVKQLPELQCFCGRYDPNSPETNHGNDHVTKDKLIKLARRAPFAIKIRTSYARFDPISLDSEY